MKIPKLHPNSFLACCSEKNVCLFFNNSANDIISKTTFQKYSKKGK